MPSPRTSASGWWRRERCLGSPQAPRFLFCFLNLIKSGRLFTFRQMCQAVIYIPLADDTHIFMFMIPIDQLVIIVISEVEENHTA
jgi:hypothetical protein